MPISRTQYNFSVRVLPVSVIPTVFQVPYVATETRVGDTVYSVSSVLSSAGYPGPLTTVAGLTVGATSHALGYVVQQSDVGSALTRADVSSNATGSAPAAISTMVIVQSLPTFAQMGFLGGNVDNSLDYNTACIFNNATLDGRGWSIWNGNGNPYGVAIQNPNGSLTLGTQTAGNNVSVTLSAGVGTTALANDGTDIGRIITFITNGNGSGTAVITGTSSSVACTVTLNNTQTLTTFGVGAWEITGPSLILGGTSGSVSLYIPTTSTIALTGDYKDRNKLFQLGNNITALVTSEIDTQHCTVTIQGGTPASTTILSSVWTVAPALNSDGFPLTASQNLYGSSTVNNSVQSATNLAPGTYHCTATSLSNALAVTFSGCINVTTANLVSNPVPDGGGNYSTTWDMTVGPSGTLNTTIMVFYSQALTFHDIPRDGSATTVGQSNIFWAPALAYYSQFPILRFMDFLNTNGRQDVNYADRPIDYAVCRNRRSWELWIDIVKAIANYAGSVLVKVILNTPPFANPAYGASVAQLLNTKGFPSTVIIFVERGNEMWNSAFKGFSTDRNAAYAEVQAVSTPKYGSGAPQIASVVGNGTTVTVTLAAALPSFIVVSATFVANDLQTSGWNQGTLTSPATVTAVTTNSFTYASTMTGTMVVTTDEYVCYFGLSSVLLSDSNFNLFLQVSKYHARAQWQNWSAWNVYRPQDRFLLSTQIGVGNAVSTTIVSFSALMNGTPTPSWAYGMVVAPYIQAYVPTTTAGTVDQAFAAFNAALPTSISNLKYHVYLCKISGLHPMCYEGGPDFTYVSGHDIQYACQRDPRMLTLVQALWTAAWEMGIEEACHYQVSPAPFAFWSALESYSDTSSPKYVGLINASGTGRTYNEIQVADSTNFWAQSINGTVNSTTSVRYAFTNTVARNYVHTFSINRGRRYKFYIEGTTDTRNIVASISIDGTVIGTGTISQNGAPSSVSAFPSQNVDPFVAELTSGAHTLSINFPAQSSGSAGYYRVTFMPV